MYRGIQGKEGLCILLYKGRKEGVVYPGIQGKEGLRILIYKGKKSCVS